MAVIAGRVIFVAFFLVSALFVSAGPASATAAVAAAQRTSQAVAEPVLRGEVSCDQLNARNMVTWKLVGTETGDVLDFSVTPAGSTVGPVQPLVVSSPGFPVAVQTVPLGATSASASLTVDWLGSPGSTVTGSVTFSPRCGPSQPWATFMVQCDHLSTVITMGNAANSPGVAELTVRKTRDGASAVVGVYLLMPGQQRTVTIGEPALLEVVQYGAAQIGNTDYYVTNFNVPPNPNCGSGEIIRPEAPGQHTGGGGSGGGPGSAPTPSADPTVTEAQAAASSASNSGSPFIAVGTNAATSGPNGTAEDGRSFVVLGWAVAAAAVLIAAGGLLAWLRLRRRAVPTQSPIVE